MSRDHFLEIYKVRNFTEVLRRNFQKNYTFGRYGTVGESMIKFKGELSIKQYLPMKLIKNGFKVWCLCDAVTGYLFNYQIYLGKEETSGKEVSLGERVVFDLISGHNFQGAHLTCGNIRPDRAGIPSNSIAFMWMDTKHVFVASNCHKDNKVVSISSRLQDGQRTTIACPKAVQDYNQFLRGVDEFSQKISCYNLDRKFKRNWLKMFFYFLNAPVFNSFICYN